MPGTHDDAARATLSGTGEVLLAFDFGLRRIGVASGNFLTCTASPVATVQVRADTPWTAIDRIVGEWRPRLLVVGLPRAGGSTSIAASAAAFAAALERRYGLEVATVDESLTSHAAHAEIKAARRAGRLRRGPGKERLDRHAACLIAEQWLNELQHEY